MIWVGHTNCRCSTATDTSTETDTETATLEALDFQPRCQHTNHNNPGWKHVHDGPATHWFIALHDCKYTAGDTYMGCAGWGKYVARMQYENWYCPCGHCAPGREMVIDLGPIL